MTNKFFLRTAAVFSFLLSTHFIAQAQFKVIGYLPNWGSFVANANAIDYSKLTHINIAFINPLNTDGDLGPTANLATVVDIVHNNNVKVLASMGGANVPSSYYTAVLATEATRTNFIDKITQLVLTYNLDGIDVDFEGNTVGATYEAFVSELKDSMHAHNKLITAAVGTWYSNRITDNALAQFDFVNIMTYDQTGPWSPNNPGQHSSYQFAINDINFWKNRGLSADKVILGVPFYGYSFGTFSGSFSWSNLSTTYPASRYNDEVQLMPSGNIIFYNGLLTMKRKTLLALEEAGGIMIWEMTFDSQNQYSLLTAIDEVVQHSASNTNPTVSITSPDGSEEFNEGEEITITADAEDSDGDIIRVDFYAGTFKIGDDYEAPYSITWTKPAGGTHELTAVVYDNLAGSSTSDAVSITITPAESSETYHTTVATIPGKIEAEDFNFGANGVAYHDTTPLNQGGQYRATGVDIERAIDTNGGYSLGWTSAGEWLEYDVNVLETGNYNIISRIARGQNGTQSFHIEMDNVNVSGSISTGNTSGWQKWINVTTSNIALTQGPKKMRIVFHNGGININHITFENVVTSAVSGKSNSFQAKIFPNPSSKTSTLVFRQIAPAQTKIVLCDQLNREVMLLSNQYYTNGEHELSFDLSSLSAGLYFCSITSNEQTETLKLIKE